VARLPVWGSRQRPCRVFERRSRVRADGESQAAPRCGAIGVTDGSATATEVAIASGLRTPMREVEHPWEFAGVPATVSSF